MIKLPTRSKNNSAPSSIGGAARPKLTLNIKFAFYIAMVVVLGIILVAINLSFKKTDDTATTYRFMDEARSARTLYQDELNRASSALTAQLEIFRQDKEIQAAIRAKDRKKLQERVTAAFTQLQQEHGVTNLFFNDDKRVNIYRAHQPSNYGDSIDRVPIVLSEKTGKTTFGLEMNPQGVLSMRAVVQVHDNVGFAGYIEMGKEVDAIFKNIKTLSGLETFLLLNKQYLSRPDWEANMKKRGLNANWDLLPSVVLARDTASINPDALLQTLGLGNAPYARVSADGKNYLSDMFEIKDVGGRRVGGVIVMRDISKYTSDTTVASVYLSIGYIVAGIIILILAASLSQLAEKRLKAANQQIETNKVQLAEQEKNTETMQQQFYAELESERNKAHEVLVELQKNQNDLNLASVVFENSTEGILITDPQTHILRVNHAFTEITGYTEEEVLGKKAQLLRSNRHDTNFFQKMWAGILEHGNWQGEIWNCRKDGETYPEWLSISSIQNEKRETIYYLGFFSDLTEKKMSEARNHHLSNFDTLTELPNRNSLESRLKDALSSAHHHRTVLALLHINLDRFKPIVDTLGHPFGDKLLKMVAERLSEQIRDSDDLARFSGDEFEVILNEVGNQQNASMVAQKLLNTFGQPFLIEDQEIYITASIGIAIYPSNADNKDDLIQSANIAARHAREDGGNCYHFYASEMNEAATQRLTMENSLRRALDHEEFILYYQPQVDLRTGKIVGVEALLRWQHPARGLIYPDEYISVLEETGLIVPVGDWILYTACHQLATWKAAGYGPLRVAVNLSARQFRQNDLLSTVSGVLEDTGLTVEQLELEITESVLLQDVPAATTVLNQLHDLGIKMAIDDFGTGYSSLSYLKLLPIDKIKIDRSFIKDIGSVHDDGAIANAVISLGHSLKMKVIAEGVETEAQLHYLTDNGCDEIQGYYFSRPVPAEDLVMFFEKGINLDTPRSVYVSDHAPVEEKARRPEDFGDLEFS